MNTINKLRKNRAFTLIELLVVVVIVGILAAFAVPRFLNQSDTAKGTKMQFEVSEAYKSASLDYADDSKYNQIAASYGAVTASFVTIAPTTTAKVYAVDGTIFVVGQSDDSSKTVYTISDDGAGKVVRSKGAITLSGGTTTALPTVGGTTAAW